jgi:hypothetical protein
MVCPKFNSPVCKLKRIDQQCTIVSVLQLGVQRGASIAGMHNGPKKIADGPINMAPLKK